jgi:hypothetical protein
MVCLWALIALLAWPALAPGAEAPTQLAGFVLGEDISKFEDRVDMSTALPLARYKQYLTEVAIKDIPGYRTGYVAYGACRDEGRIARIKLKYANRSKKFFEKLLARYKKRFGKPSTYRGDPFKAVITWKWSFTTEAGHDISLILQHNPMDPEETLGNSVKMTDRTLVKQERACYSKKHPDKMDDPVVKEEPDIHWDMLIPK